MDRLHQMSGMTMAVFELLKIGLALYGVFLLMVYGSRAYEAYNSQFWPTVTGEITRSAVDVSGSFDGTRRYHSSIKYAYAAEQSGNDQAGATNEPFISQRVRIAPIPPADSFDMAAAKLEPYPKGSLVEVYYNPSRPERSLLEADFSLAYLFRPILGLLCLGGALSLRKIGIES